MNLKDTVRRFHIEYLRFRSTHCRSINISGTTLIIAPHPDDEVIGCGGLIARLVGEGKTPHIIIMTGGEGSHENCCSTSADEIIKARRNLTRKALSILGVSEQYIHELNFPDGGISENCDQTAALKKKINALKPQSVFVPHWGEGWNDHVETARIVKRILSPDVDIWEYCVWMWFYNVWRGLDWKNAYSLHMTPAEKRLKLEAMDAYTKPLAPCGKPWSGVLPQIFIDANSTDTELYFRIRWIQP